MLCSEKLKLETAKINICELQHYLHHQTTITATTTPIKNKNFNVVKKIVSKGGKFWSWK